MKKLAGKEQWTQLYQIAFDLYEIASQRFVSELRQTLTSLDVGPGADQVCPPHQITYNLTDDSHPSCPEMFSTGS
jgi:hypothetical protein